MRAYGLRRKPDFDNYYALAQAEDLVAAANQALREGLDNPQNHFRANFLASVSDSDYAKVLDDIAKVHSLSAQPPHLSLLSLPRLLVRLITIASLVIFVGHLIILLDFVIRSGIYPTGPDSSSSSTPLGIGEAPTPSDHLKLNKIVLFCCHTVFFLSCTFYFLSFPVCSLLSALC